MPTSGALQDQKAQGRRSLEGEIARESLGARIVISVHENPMGTSVHSKGRGKTGRTPSRKYVNWRHAGGCLFVYYHTGPDCLVIGVYLTLALLMSLDSVDSLCVLCSLSYAAKILPMVTVRIQIRSGPSCLLPVAM